MALAFHSATNLSDSSQRNVKIKSKIPEIVDSNDPYITYELQRCVQWIDGNSFQKVALQFPDSLLHLSDKIALKLQKTVLSSAIYILADTSYGSCCVDEVAAEHVSADAIIHFGLACLTPCNRLPVLYIFGKWPVDSKRVAEEFRQLITDRSIHCILMFDVTYSHASSGIYDAMVQHFPDLVLSELRVPKFNSDSSESSVCIYTTGGRTAKLKEGLHISDYAIFFIGQEGGTLANLMITLNRCQFYSYNPINKVAQKEGVNINRTLQKRYYAVERARNAQIVAILVGTLGISKYLDIIERLKDVARHAGKKAYTIVVGRLNPSKLANFPEVDIFILIACPEHSLLDYKEYYRPIITPFEFELACVEERQWTGDYITDFKQLMPGSPYYVPLSGVSSREPRTSVSLITGQMYSLSQKSQLLDLPADSLLLKDNLTVSAIHSEAGGEFLMNRSWQGLQSTVGETPAAMIHQGKYGTAASYTHEKNLLCERIMKSE